MAPPSLAVPTSVPQPAAMTGSLVPGQEAAWPRPREAGRLWRRAAGWGLRRAAGASRDRPRRRLEPERALQSELCACDGTPVASALEDAGADIEGAACA